MKWSYLILLVLISCGDDDAGEDKPAPKASEIVTSSSSVIVDDLDWKPVSDLALEDELRQIARKVGKLRYRSVRGHCSLSLISPDLAVTSSHCVVDSALRGAYGQWGGREYLCDEVVLQLRSSDLAVFRCSGDPGKDHGHLGLSAQGPDVGESIQVIHHNCDAASNVNCEIKQLVSPGEILDVNERFQHSADTLSGSSGSPVFVQRSDSWTWVGVHSLGQGGDRDGRGVTNYGFPVSRLLFELEQGFPGVDFRRGAHAVQLPPDEDIEELNPFQRPRGKFTGDVNAGESILLRFDVRATSRVVLTLKSRVQLGDVNFELLNSQKRRIAFSNRPSDREIISVRIPSGQYYVKVTGVDSNSFILRWRGIRK